jgi:selenocysteine lyase/cysteine desulfurase
LDEEMRKAVGTWSLKEVVESLMALRGVNPVTAISLTGELGDISRFDSPRPGSPIGLARSIQYLVQIGVDRIYPHNKELSNLLIEGLAERKAEIISPEKDEERSSIVGARFPGKDASDIAGRLNEARVIVSARKDFVRFSPHLYNEADDIQRALEEIDRFLK